MSGITLMHSEADAGPECRIVFGAGRLQDNDKTDSRVVEITFKECLHARINPKHDNSDLDAEGFAFLERGPDGIEWINWFTDEWRRRGYCPHSGFWVAEHSSWLSELMISDVHHYIICGRDGYVELIATKYQWREWEWSRGHREDAIQTQPIAEGSGNGGAA